MQDDIDSGSERQSGWQPPEYVSPWTSASNAGEASDTGREPDSGDTIAFGPGSGSARPSFRPPGHQQAGYQQGGEQQPAYQQQAYQQPWFGEPRHSQPGYSQPGYSQPGYSQPGYSQPGHGEPGYGPPQGGYGAWGGGPGDQYAWGGYGAPPPPQGSRFGKFLAYVAVAALAAGAGAGAAIALNHNGSNPPVASGSGNTNPGGNGGGIQYPFNGGNGGNQGNGFAPPPNGGQNRGQNGTGGSNSGTGSLNAQALAQKVDPGIVDITSQLKYSQATAEGTGMVISPNGLVLTNNHVIDQATSVTATLVVSGKTYTARVVGYDSTDDVALLQLEGASGLKTVKLGDSGKVKVGDAVLALGNAGGRGGAPSTAQGTINGLDRTIQASDNGGDTQSTETLHGMLETNAPIQEGDSGGPLVDSGGKVVGMDTAANTASNFQQNTVGTTGFAIPINHAITIVNQISAGHASATVHIGLAGFIGINVADASTGCTDGLGGIGSPVNSGALVCQVFAGTPAATAGLVNGDVITSIDGHSVGNANGLTTLMAGDHPGDQLSIVYVDADGGRHSTTVTLGAVAK